MLITTITRQQIASNKYFTKNLQLHELNFRENYRHPRESNVGFSAQIKHFVATIIS